MADEPNMEQKDEAENKAKGAPSVEEKAKRLEAQLEEMKAQLEEAKAQNTTLSESLKQALTEDDIKAAVEKAQKEAEQAQLEASEKAAQREKRLVVENALIKANCIDTKGALAHINLDDVEIAKDGHVSGLDVAGLAESHKHLFQAANTAQINSAGSPSGGGAMTKEKIMAIKDGTKRRQAIKDNIELFEEQ